MSWSGYSRNPSRRRAVQGQELSPFCGPAKGQGDNTTSPSQLHEITQDPFSTTNDGSSGPTMKDYEAQLSHYQKENFNLKLRIYFLEERLGPFRGGNDKEDPHKKNIELKVETETLRKELWENQQLLRDAAKAMDHLEKQHAETMQKVIDEQKIEKQKLESKIEEMKKELESRLELPNHENSTAMYALAFNMPQLIREKNGESEDGLEEKLRQKITDLENQLREFEDHLKNKKEECDNLEVELSNTREEKEMLDQELERYEGEINDMKKRLDEKEQELETSRKQITDLEEALMAKEPEIRIKVQEIAERDKMLEEANSKLEAKEKVLVEIQITLDEKQKQIEALRASLQSKDAALAGLRSKLAESENATRDLQDKMKSQWMEGSQQSPNQMIHTEKNVMKKHVMSYRNHSRRQKDIPGGLGSNITKRPGTAPPSGRGSEDEVVHRLQEELDIWKKKAEDMQKIVQQNDALVKNQESENTKIKGTLQGVIKHAKELEREMEKCKQDVKRKDKKIRDLLCELTVAHDQVNRAKWEVEGGGGGRQHGMGFSSGLDDVNDMADEESERLWAELEDKKKKLKQVTDEKNALSSELEKKTQSLMSALKEKEVNLAGFEEKYKSAAAQLAEKTERIQSLEAQFQSLSSVSCLENITLYKTLSQRAFQHINQHSNSLREVFTHRLSSAAEEHSFLHSHIQKLQRNLHSTPEREKGPRGPSEETEEARREAEEMRALLGGHLWELAIFLEGLLDDLNNSLSESCRSTLRRALEWSRNLSFSVLSTTGLGDGYEKDATRNSLAMLRNFPSFCACVETPAFSSMVEGGETNLDMTDRNGGHVTQTIVISEVESPKREYDSSELQGVARLSVESLHSTVEALRARVRELEREVVGKASDLREGSSEMGRGANSGESVKTVRDVRSSHVTRACDTLKVVGHKIEGRSEMGPQTCTPPGVIASPSESEGWSEPDRSVSQARIGLEDMARRTPSVAVVSAAQQSTPESGGSSLVETRTPSKRSHGEVRRLQNRLRGLEQVIEALRAELRVYHSMPQSAQTLKDSRVETPPQKNVLLEVAKGVQEGPCMRDAEVNTSVSVQSEPTETGTLGHLLEEVRCQRDKLEFSLKHNELIGRQLEGVLSTLKCHQVEDGMAALCQSLKEATERLEEEQARCRDLHSQLTSAKSSLSELERELKESKALELKLRDMLKEKEKLLIEREKAIKKDEEEKAKECRLTSEDIISGASPRSSNYLKFNSKEEMKDRSRSNGSLFENQMEKIDVRSPKRSFSFGDEGLVQNDHATMGTSYSSNKSIQRQEKNEFSEQVLNLSENQKGSRSLNDVSIYEKFTNVHMKALALLQEAKDEKLMEVENEALSLRLALEKAQDQVCAEEQRAMKAEEEVKHWMKVAKAHEEAIKKQESFRLKTLEDPSEFSSSSAMSGIIPDLPCQRSEMSDYVSDQTGGEESEPSVSQMSTRQSRNLRERPTIIPLEVSHGMTYLSPSADTSPTARHDAFSSPDLGIESDPGRFSSLESQPLKSPVGIDLSRAGFTEVRSSGNGIVYSNSFTTIERSNRSKNLFKNTDDVVSLSYVEDLRFENERLKQRLAETQKSLDETLCKLQSANRRKLHVEHAICNQLQKTHLILRKARVNLTEKKP